MVYFNAETQRRRDNMETVITLFTKDQQTHLVKLTIPPGNIFFADLVQPFRILFHKIIDLETREKKVSCKKGCSACCNQLVPLSIPEVFSLYRIYESLPTGHKKRVKKRFARNKNSLHKAGLLSELKNPVKVRSMDQKYFNLGLACPFLETGSCSIYDSRPFVCMEYYVKTPPVFCTSPYTSPVEKITIGYNIGALLTAFSARLLGLAKTPVPLIIVGDWAENFTHYSKKKFSAAWMYTQLLTTLSEVKPEAGIIQEIRVTLNGKETIG